LSFYTILSLAGDLSWKTRTFVFAEDSSLCYSSVIWSRDIPLFPYFVLTCCVQLLYVNFTICMTHSSLDIQLMKMQPPCCTKCQAPTTQLHGTVS